LARTIALLLGFTLCLILAGARAALAQDRGPIAGTTTVTPDPQNPDNVIERTERSGQTPSEEFDDWTETTYAKNDPKKKPLKVVTHEHHIYREPPENGDSSSHLSPSQFSPSKEIHNFKLDITTVFNPDGTFTVDGSSLMTDDSNGEWTEEFYDPDAEDWFLYDVPAFRDETFHETWRPSTVPGVGPQIESGTIKRKVSYESAGANPLQTEYYYLPHVGWAPIQIPREAFEKYKQDSSAPSSPRNSTFPIAGGAALLGSGIYLMTNDSGAHAGTVERKTTPGQTTPCSMTPCSQTSSRKRAARRSPAFELRIRL
jgi:hypothetical protein